MTLTEAAQQHRFTPSYCLCIKGLCVFVCQGFKVAVISRDSSRLEKLRSFVSPNTKDNLTTIVGNVGKSGYLSCPSLLWGLFALVHSPYRIITDSPPGKHFKYKSKLCKREPEKYGSGNILHQSCTKSVETLTCSAAVNLMLQGNRSQVDTSTITGSFTLLSESRLEIWKWRTDFLFWLFLFPRWSPTLMRKSHLTIILSIRLFVCMSYL